ncbi:MAG: fumarylacetoacetate hydrolase family protein [bacterium]
MAFDFWPLSGSGEKIPVRNLYAVGWNYAEHNVELGRDAGVPIVVFQKSSAGLIGDGDSLQYPQNSQDLQYEGELVVLIEKDGDFIPRERAMEHVWGYAAGIDFTLRDVQKEAKAKGQPWFASKNFRGAAAVGPFKRLNSGLSNETLRLTVNGVVRQEAKLSRMANDVPSLIAKLSENLTLLRGDIIFTGTPAGVGPVQPGDLVVCEISSLPLLSIRISA